MNRRVSCKAKIIIHSLGLVAFAGVVGLWAWAWVR